jgi:hypothetical protein
LDIISIDSNLIASWFTATSLFGALSQQGPRRFSDCSPLHRRVNAAAVLGWFREQIGLVIIGGCLATTAVLRRLVLLIILAWLFALLNKVSHIDTAVTLRCSSYERISLQGLIIPFLLGCLVFSICFLFLALNIALDISAVASLSSCSVDVLVVFWLVDHHRFVRAPLSFLSRHRCLQTFAKFRKSGKRLRPPFQLLFFLIGDSALPGVRVWLQPALYLLWWRLDLWFKRAILKFSLVL